MRDYIGLYCKEAKGHCETNIGNLPYENKNIKVFKSGWIYAQLLRQTGGQDGFL